MKPSAIRRKATWDLAHTLVYKNRGKEYHIDMNPFSTNCKQHEQFENAYKKWVIKYHFLENEWAHLVEIYGSI